MSLIARVRGLPKLSTGITHYVNHGYTSPVHSCAVKYFQRASSRRLSTNLFISKYKTNRLFTGAAFCGTLGVASYVYFEYLNDSSVHCEDAGSQQEQSDDKISSIKYKLYQYETCPFCCKVRAFFDYYGIEYEKVEVNPLFRRELKAITDYRKVPVLVAGESQINDSSLIISVIRTNYIGKGEIEELLRYYPALEAKDERGKAVIEYQNRYNIMYQAGQRTKEEVEAVREESQWRRWVDSTYVHMLSPNIYRTMGESLEAFEYISSVGNFNAVERVGAKYVGAVAMYIIGRRLKKRHRLRDDVRSSLYSETRKWTKAIGKERKFMGGAKPNLADLNMYGVLSSIEHLPTFKDLQANTSIGPWYKRMKKLVENHAGAGEMQGALKR